MIRNKSKCIMAIIPLYHYTSLQDHYTRVWAKPSPNFPANEGSPHEFLVSTGSSEGKQTKNHWLAGATLTMYER